MLVSFLPKYIYVVIDSLAKDESREASSYCEGLDLNQF
jgi:hypothetical protein